MTSTASSSVAAPDRPVTRRTQDLIEDVTRNLRPAPHIHILADTIMARLTAAGPYNGVHLRMEEDAHMWDVFASSNGPEVSGRALHGTLGQRPGIGLFIGELQLA